MSFPLSAEESDDAKKVIWGILEKLSDDAADRFNDAYDQCLDDLCRKIPEDIERGFPPTTNEDASLALSRPTYRVKFETTKKRSRLSSMGVWYVFFWLIDGDGDRVPETLHVVGVRHGRAPAMWSEASEMDQDEDSDLRDDDSPQETG
nr:hypothetical protein [Armatimonas sp.]